MHRARPGDDGGALPPYVARDCDTALRDRLAAAGRDGGLVLVTGDSTAGKTRAAFEALRAVLPDHLVVQPASGSDMSAVARAVARADSPCVVWLDDLERYLGPDGLTTGLLAQLTRTATPVLATIRLRQFDMFRPRAGSPDGDAEEMRALTAAVALRVLNVADRVDADRVWSEHELARARACDDSRIADAVAHHGSYGVAEYLAAGPALLDEWLRAWHPAGHPRGAALVAAAVALARTGLRGPYPRALLVRLHRCYLAEAGGGKLRPEGLDDAFAWAAELRHGATSLLLPVDADGDADHWEVFDYLVDHTDGPVPGEVWDEALVQAERPAERVAVGAAALDAGLPHIMEAACLPLVGDYPGLAGWLARRLDLQRRPQEAEELFRSALEARSATAATDYGLFLARSERPRSAEVFLRLSADHGDDRAMVLLGELLRQTGRGTEAEEWYHRAADAGSLWARTALGMFLADNGRESEAEPQLRRAVEAEHPGAAAALALLLIRTGRETEARQSVITAPPRERGFARMRLAMGLSHAARDDHAGARLEYARTAVVSRIEAAGGPGGDVLLMAAYQPEDEYTYWKATRGDVYAALDLAGLGPRERPHITEDLHRRILDAGRSGDNAAAAALARPAADTGDPTARSLLVTALTQLGREEEALPYVRTAVQAGEHARVPQLALLLTLTGRAEEAEQYLPRVTEEKADEAYRDAGYFLLMKEVARLREEDTSDDPALRGPSAAECEERVERYYRFAARLGHTEAAAALADLLDATGRSEEAAGYYRQAADGGHLSATVTTAMLLEAAGDREAAERYYRRAADRGHPQATARLRGMLVRTGRWREARQHRRRAVAAARRRGLLVAGRVQKTAWCLVALVSFGLLAWVPFLYVAIRRGKRSDWVTFGVFLLAGTMEAVGAEFMGDTLLDLNLGWLFLTFTGMAVVMIWDFTFDTPGGAPGNP